MIASKRWTVDSSHAGWLRDLLRMASGVLSKFDAVENVWNNTYRSYRIYQLTRGGEGDGDGSINGRRVKTTTTTTTTTTTASSLAVDAPNMVYGNEDRDDERDDERDEEEDDNDNLEHEYVPTEIPYEILHVEPKLHFLRRQLSGLVGTLSGALLRLSPPKLENVTLSHVATKWMNASVVHLRDDCARDNKDRKNNSEKYTPFTGWEEENNEKNKKQQQKKKKKKKSARKSIRYCTESDHEFLRDMVNASTGGLAKATRHLAWKAQSPRRSSNSRNDDLSLDGSAHGHLQELARSVSHRVRRNLAVRVDSVNEAERVVAAAMIYHSGMTSVARRYADDFEEMRNSSSSSDDDLLNVSTDSLGDVYHREEKDGDPPPPPAALIHVWKQARRARKWLKIQKDQEHRTGSGRQLNAYEKHAKSVCDRALLLMELRPSHLSGSGSVSGDATSSGSSTTRNDIQNNDAITKETSDILESVLSFVTDNTIGKREMKSMRVSSLTSTLVFDAREDSLHCINSVLRGMHSGETTSSSDGGRNPDTILHVLVPVVESFRHLPSAMAASGILVQDRGVHVALTELYQTMSMLMLECESSSRAETLSFLNSLDNTRQQQWRSLLCVLMDSAVCLTPIMQATSLMSSSIFGSLLSIATEKGQGSVASKSRDESRKLKESSTTVLEHDEDKEIKEKSDIDNNDDDVKDKESSAFIDDSLRLVLPDLWTSELREVVVTPSVETSTINYAHSQDSDVLLCGGGHWQSDGNLPHWIQLTCPQPISLRRLKILLMNDDLASAGGMASRIDHSFCPRVLSIFVGTSPDYLQELRSMEVAMTTDWITIVD